MGVVAVCCAVVVAGLAVVVRRGGDMPPPRRRRRAALGRTLATGVLAGVLAAGAGGRLKLPPLHVRGRAGVRRRHHGGALAALPGLVIGVADILGG